MKIISKEEFLSQKNLFLTEFEKGKIFIFPTDTIYGIGCSATNPLSVDKVREIKQRDSKPFAVIAPSKDWIKENCLVSDEKYLDKLPGPFTFIFKLKETKLAVDEILKGKTSLGVRIPDNWFAKEITLPIVASSVNISGEDHAREVKDISLEIKEKVDYIIDCGALNGKPSTIIDVTTEKEIIVRN